MSTRNARWLVAIVFLLLVPAAGSSSAGQLTLAWNANTESDLAGYKLRIGNASGAYQTTIDVHNTTTYTATGLVDGQVYYFTVTAYNASGAESTYSTEVSGTVGTAAPPTGLVAAYGFDEGTGTTAGDGSGNGNAGTISGATWAATGRFGKALSFNGTASRVIVADAATLDLTNGMTLEAWLNPSVLSGYRSAILKETSTALTYSLYAYNNAPKPASTINVGGSDMTVEGTTALALNTWTHLASTYDGTTLRVFVNGVQISTMPASGSMIASGGPLSIGGNGIWGEFFSGLIDEVRVYNRALASSEIQADMTRAVVGGAPTDTTAPTVSITAPAAGSVTGAVNVSANAADNVGVASVQFKLDAANLGALDTVAPFTIAWDTTTAAIGAHTLTAVARDAAGNSTTSTVVNVTVSNDTTAPVISGITASAVTAAGATVGWVTGEASDSQVEYGLTTSYGTLTTLNASMVTTHSAAVTGLTDTTLYHYRVRSKDAAGNLAMSADATFTTRDGTAPTVSVTSPAPTATVSATITVSASASDNVAVAGVQLMLDGVTLGAEDIATPYAKTWDTTTATNGTHVLTAVARDAAGNTRTSTAVSVTVSNDAAAPVISGITASAITATGATVGWVTSEASDSQVEYGLTTTYGTLTTLNASMVTTHSAAVAGLTDTTIYHYRVRSKDAAGNLAMSADATFTTRDATAPAVSVTSPAAGATVAATITVSASASDNVAVAGLQFKLDGVNLGTEDVAAPYTKAWDTTAATNGIHTLTAVARDAAGNSKTSAAVSVTVSNDATGPVISGVTASAIMTTGATVGWVTGEAGDSQVEYGLTASYGTLTTLNASMVTTHSTAVTGLADATLYHYRVRSKDAAGNLGMSADATFTTRDVTAPAVAITNPTAGALLSGTITVSAGASDNLAVAGVQFTVDGVNLGAEDTAGPFTKAWDTKTATNGVHTLRAVARDAAGNSTTSSAVTATVSNDLTAPALSHILISSIGASGATISWQSDEAGDSQIEYGLTTAYGSLDALNGALVLAHAETLTGLAASSQYHFRVKSRDASGNLASSADLTFSTRDGTPPSVSIVSPFNGATVAATVTLQAAASDNVGVVGVAFSVDGVPLGAERTSAPYTVAWDTTRLSDGAHVITAVARDADGDATTSAGVSVMVANGILWLAPEDTSLNLDTANYSNGSVLGVYTWPDYEVANAIVLKFDLSALPAGAVVQNAALNLALVESDAAAENTYNVSVHKIVGRRPVVSAATGYTLDGTVGWTPNACCYNSVPLAQADISPAYDTRPVDKTAGYKTWDLTQVVQNWAATPGNNKGILLNADTSQLRDHYRNFASMEYADPALRPFLRVSFTRTAASDTTPPTVSMTAPATGATVTGVVTLSASASDNVGVAGVQFKVDGTAVGAERTAAPFTTAWDTSTTANGPHTLSAVARDAAGNVTGSATVSVTAANAVATLTPQDTYLNLDTTNYSTAATLQTYTWPDYQVANAILMKFDLSSLPAGAVVQEAVLSLALVTSDSTADPTYTITIHKIEGISPVLTGATGNKAGGGNNNWAPNPCCYNSLPMAQANISAPYDTERVDKTPGFKTWTITEMVRDWLANPSTNSGLLLNSDATALRDRYRYFASVENPNATLRPFLTIRYVQP